MDRIDSVVLSQIAAYRPIGESFNQGNVKKTETLPFTIKVVSNLVDLKKAVEMRRAAYRRHLPEFAETMGVEPLDGSPGTVVLLAQSRLDGGPLGTMRVQTNAFGPLAVEQSVSLPDWLGNARLAEATRLGVAHGAIGRMVKVALCKAYYMYCAQNGIDWMLITARSPLDREYDAMLFEDVYGQNEFLPMAHVGGMPHRVMAKPVALVRQRWAKVNHSFFGFFFETDHPDIDVSVAPKQGEAGHGVECGGMAASASGRLRTLSEA
ncbi:N-acyl amino acid synthase FeeM domain-containing protein [Paraburkholderia sp. A1RO-5L]|uniref:N-acyl amino acid synthase FeeM domain-containing protein n=1 Tax=unclassified Paraburkholderia TaxID=2615204 RepID=UPI003B8042D8